MERLPVEERGVEHEAGGAAPRADDLGQRGGHDHRQRDAVRAGALGQPLAFPGGEPAIAAHHPDAFHLVRLDGQRKGRSGRQFGKAGRPVAAVGLAVPGAQPVALGEVAGEGGGQRRQLGALAAVEDGQVLQQDLDAAHVGDEEVDVGVETVGSAGQQRERQVEDLAALDLQAAM